MTPEEELSLVALEEVEFMGIHRGLAACPTCGGIMEAGHLGGCTLKKALDALERKREAGSSSVAVEQPNGGLLYNGKVYQEVGCGWQYDRK